MPVKYDLRECIGSEAHVMRSVVFTRVIGDQLDSEGVAHPFEDVLLGSFKPARATRLYASTMPDENIRITRCEVMQQPITMPLSEFWLNGAASADPRVIRTFVMTQEV